MPTFARGHRRAVAPGAFGAVALLALAAAGCSGSDRTRVYSVTVEPASIEFAATYGRALPQPQTITATWEGDGLIVGTPPGTPPPPWLSVQEVGSARTGNGAAFTLSVASTTLRPGPWQGTLRFTTGKSDGSASTFVDVPVTYTVADDLVLSPVQLALTANDGTLASGEIQVSRAGGVGVAWTATADPGLHLAATSGAAGTPVEVSYDALAQALPAGSASLDVRVSATISGATVTKIVPVAVEIAPHRIYAERNGVALTSVPGVSRLAASVHLVDGAGTRTGTWSAESDQPWLVIDGTQDDQLSFHADVSGLADGLHFATVTVSSSGPRVEGPDEVRVGLYVSGAAPVDGQLATGAGQTPVPDPIRPWVWLVSPADRSRIAAFNVYSGLVEKTLALSAPVVRVAMSGDGAVLFGGGMTEAGGYLDIARVDVDSGTLLGAFAAQGHAVLATARPGGREFVLTDAAELYDAATGAVASLSTWGSVFWNSPGWELAVSADQRYLYGLTTGVSPPSLVRARLLLSGANEVVSLADPRSTTLFDDLPGWPLAPTPDGSRVLFVDQRARTNNLFGVWGPGTSAGSLVSLATFTGSTPSDRANTVDVAPDGRVVAVAGYTIDCYDAPLGTRTHSYALPSAQAWPWDVRFSGDGERAVVAGMLGGSTNALWAYPSR